MQRTATVLASTKKERPLNQSLGGKPGEMTGTPHMDVISRPFRTIDIESTQYQEYTKSVESSTPTNGHRKPVEQSSEHDNVIPDILGYPALSVPKLAASFFERNNYHPFRCYRRWRIQARCAMRPGLFVVLDYITEKCWMQHGIGAYIEVTIAELMANCGGISNHTAHYLLVALARRGYLEMTESGIRPVIYRVRPAMEDFTIPVWDRGEMEETSNSGHERQTDELEIISNSSEQEEISNQDDFMNPNAPVLLEEISSNPLLEEEQMEVFSNSERQNFGLLEISSNRVTNLLEESSIIVDSDVVPMEEISNSFSMENFSNPMNQPVEPVGEQMEEISNSSAPMHVHVCNSNNKFSNRDTNMHVHGAGGKPSFRDRLRAKGIDNSATPDQTAAYLEADKRRPRTNVMTSLKSMLPQSQEEASNVPPKQEMPQKSPDELYKDGAQAIRDAGIADSRPKQTEKDLQAIHKAAGCGQQEFEATLQQAIEKTAQKGPEQCRAPYLLGMLRKMLAGVVAAVAVM